MAERLRSEIRQGILRPGTHLRQDEVAQRLGVSTTPVREAFQVLQAEGLLTMDPHRGVVVFQPTADDVREYYEIREQLETLAIEKAIKALRDDGPIKELELLLERMRSVDDDTLFIELNDRFHARMYELSGSRRLCAIIGNLRMATSAYVHMFIHATRRSGRADEEHREILEALRTRDVNRARRAVRRHIHHTVEQALAFLAQLEAGEAAS